MPLISAFFSKGLSGEAGASYLLYSMDRDEQIDRLLYAVYEERMVNRVFSSSMINGLLNIVFVQLLRNYNHMLHFSNIVKTGWKSEYLPVFQYIQEHYADVTMSALQKRFHYSDRQLNRIVQKCTGKSYSALIVELKMERAKTLLLRKAGPTAAIAEAVGFHDVNAFYRAFHNYTGQTLKQWKRRNEM